MRAVTITAIILLRWVVAVRGWRVALFAEMAALAAWVLRHPRHVLRGGLSVALTVCLFATPASAQTTEQAAGDAADAANGEVASDQSLSSLSRERIQLSMPPYFNVEGPRIDVGRYSQDMQTNDLEALHKTAARMQADIDALMPEQMFALAIQLYNNGDPTEAAYWYYHARLRTVTMAISLNESGNAWLIPSYYGVFMDIVGAWIIAWSQCDPDRWMATLERVIAANTEPPPVPQMIRMSVLESTWQKQHQQTLEGFVILLEDIRAKRDDWAAHRVAIEADEAICAYQPRPVDVVGEGSETDSETDSGAAVAPASP